MSLNGKAAVVTGSTSGIGLGIARALAREGAGVLLNGLGDAGFIRDLCEDFARSFGVPVAHHPADMTRPREIGAMIAEAQSRFGGLDILVNNAGIQHVAPIVEFPDERWDAVIAVNLSAAFHAMKAALPGMMKSGWGRVINIASAHGLVASEHKAAYVAAKHGIIGLTKVAAIECANSGVTVNAICPGWVLTPLVEQQVTERAMRDKRDIEAEKHALVAEKQPMARFTTPEQIGGLAVFLCSDAADTITGAPLSIDGGWVAW